MYEIRIHGRGGQGAVMAGGILASALVLEGKFVNGDATIPDKGKALLPRSNQDTQEGEECFFVPWCLRGKVSGSF